jgi:tripartite-type tricarboxylate transporter receptor subunit TctC
MSSEGDVMKILRRKFLHLAAGAAGLPAVPRLASTQAWAQSYPSRPVRFVVGFAPGGGGDLSTRLMAQWLSERLGQQFVVENRVGASSNLATEQVVRAPPDGYTLIQLNVANAINASLYSKLSFDVLRDLAPVASFMRVPNVMEISPTLPVKTVPEFIAYAKANPGKVLFASSGVGTTIHMSGELFKTMAAIDIVHVPYRGLGAGGYAEPHDWHGARDLRQSAAFARADTRRQAARARGHLDDALAGHAGASDRGGFPAGL